jgi:flagellar motor switch protein FliN/FliY
MGEKATEMKSEIPILPGYEALEDVPITLHAELDHKTIPFERLVNLKVGSVLQLGRPTGENVDLYAENVLLGSGEILIVDSTLAVRIADLRNKPTETKGLPVPKGPSIAH